MALSPSDLWRQVQIYKYISVEECIAVRNHNGGVHVQLQIGSGGNKVFKSKIVGNALAMMYWIGEFRQLRNECKAADIKRILDEETAKSMAKFLDKQREIIALKHREKLAEEQRRINVVLRNVRGPIQAILDRCKPVKDQYAYLNVYGQPAEVNIY